MPGESYETLREAFLFVQAVKKKTAKTFANSRSIDRGESEQLSCCSPDTTGNDGVQMWVEVGCKGTESLNRDYAAGTDLLAAQIRVAILMKPAMLPEWTWLQPDDRRSRWCKCLRG